MPLFIIVIKIFLVIFSSLASFLSLVLMASPTVFLKIEEYLSLEFGGSADFVTVLEGKINFLNDWVLDNRIFFGPFLAILAALNTRSAFFF